MQFFLPSLHKLISCMLLREKEVPYDLRSIGLERQFGCEWQEIRRISPITNLVLNKFEYEIVGKIKKT